MFQHCSLSFDCRPVADAVVVVITAKIGSIKVDIARYCFMRYCQMFQRQLAFDFCFHPFSCDLCVYIWCDTTTEWCENGFVVEILLEVLKCASVCSKSNCIKCSHTRTTTINSLIEIENERVKSEYSMYEGMWGGGGLLISIIITITFALFRFPKVLLFR